MTNLEAMLCRIGGEQEDAGDVPFPFQCSDGESDLVEELRAGGLVQQRWAGRGPAIVRFQDGYVTFNALSLTDKGRSAWNRLESTT